MEIVAIQDIPHVNHFLLIMNMIVQSYVEILMEQNVILAKQVKVILMLNVLAGIQIILRNIEAHIVALQII